MLKLWFALLITLISSLGVAIYTPNISAALERYIKQVNATVTVVLVDGPRCGDLDGNGSIDLEDANAALQFVVNIEDADADQLRIGDLDMDGEITIIDVAAILKIAAEDLPPPTSCGPP